MRLPGVSFHETETFNLMQLNPLALQQKFRSLLFFGTDFHRSCFLSPGAGVNGGELVGEGTVEDLIKSPRSITGKYLSGELKIEVPKERRKPTVGLKCVVQKKIILKTST